MEVLNNHVIIYAVSAASIGEYHVTCMCSFELRSVSVSASISAQTFMYFVQLFLLF